MDEQDFEGTLVLEKLAAVGKVDEFFEAIDLDDFATAQALMRQAKIDFETISTVLKMVSDADGKHS
jgi:iron uptake system EfeUOB component EfeO/EfeM